MRFLSLSETQRIQARLKLENQRLAADYDNMLGLIDALDMPFWMRAADGRLKWVNRAYAAAVEAADAGSRGPRRQGIPGHARRARRSPSSIMSRPVFEQTLSTVIEGDRRVFAVTDFAGGDGSAGIAVDKSAIEAIREEYERTVRSHADTLDQLTTAVAIFDTDEKLRFFNQAFQKLWDLDHALPATARPTMRCCSTGCAAKARSPSSRNGGAGRKTCSAPTARSNRRSIGGICPTAGPSASSPTRSPRAA